MQRLQGTEQTAAQKNAKHNIYKQDMHKQEIMMADKLHKEELAHKEVQLSVMRNYLLKKIEIVEKLHSIREKEVKHLCKVKKIIFI